MKSFLLAAIIVEFVIAALLASSGCILRLDKVKAFRNQVEHPSFSNLAELQRQRTITSIYRIGFSIAIFVSIAAPTILIAKFKFNKNAAEQDATANT